MAEDMASRYIARDFFVYNTVHQNIAPTNANTQTITIQADSDFQLEKLTYFAESDHTTASGRTIPACQVLIVDTGSGRQISDMSFPIANLFGTGEIPFVLKQPKIFLSRSTLNVTVTNFGSSPITVRLSFIGSKLFLR